MTWQDPAENDPTTVDSTAPDATTGLDATAELSEEELRQAGPRDWADEAAQARTADDPRAVAPHDRRGTPSTGDTR